jgi:ATP-binding cassette, subfamily B, multidrug efflux pump
MHFGGMHEGDVSGKFYDRRLLGRLFRYLVPHRGLLAGSLALLPLFAAGKLVEPWIIKKAIDEHIVVGDTAGLPLLAALFLAVIMGESLVMFVQVLLLQRLGQKVMASLRREMFAHVQRLSSAFFDRTPAGSVVTRLTSDVEVLGELFSSGVVTIVGDLLLLAGIVAAMLWMNVRLSGVVLTILPVLLFIVFFFRRMMRLAFREVRSRLARLNVALSETVAGMAVIRLFNREEAEQRTFTALDASYRDANLPVITWDASLFALVEALSSVTAGLIIWYGGGEIIRGSLTFGELVAFLSYGQKFFDPVRDLSAKFSVMQGGMAALERIFALLDRREYLPEKDSPAPDPGPVKAIEFRDVWFAYDDEDYVLKGFDIILREGEQLALVGETGGGKTTVTRLLARMYEVSRGSITLNGTDIRDLSLQVLRRKIGLVLQEPFLFTGTLGYNITLGDPEAAARMEEAAAAVGADRFIRRLPKGYDEEVRERGSNFSAGERQLISFARALAFDPEILVLDEATSSVDSESERLIRQGLKGLLRGRTSIIVAHRLSTIREADRIVVIHRGEKREEGTHAELMAATGLYWRLHELQFRNGADRAA